MESRGRSDRSQVIEDGYDTSGDVLIEHGAHKNVVIDFRFVPRT
jgi:hypothetical protein